MIRFFDEKHIYLNPKNESYRSVTSILKKLEPQKDWDEIKRKYAKKNKITVEEVTRLWNHEKDISIVRGKKAHTQKELHSLSSATFMTEDAELIPVITPLMEDGVKINKSMVFKDGIYPEVILWLDRVKLAGQADKIEIINNVINVYDYKTNKKIEKESFRNYRGEYDTLNFPCAHLDACNFNVYSLQLNMYAYMIKRHNPLMTIGKMEIIHLLFENPEDIEEITGEVIYTVPNLQKEIVNILNAIEANKI